MKSIQQACLKSTSKSSPLFLKDTPPPPHHFFKQLPKSTLNVIFDPSSWNARWKITFRARQTGRKQPAESQLAKHACCQPLSLNLMPLSLLPPFESNLVERQKWALVTGMSTAVCFQLSRRTLPACVSLLLKCPSVFLPLVCPSQLVLRQLQRPTVTCLIILHCYTTHTRMSLWLTA